MLQKEEDLYHFVSQAFKSEEKEMLNIYLKGSGGSILQSGVQLYTFYSGDFILIL